MDWHSIDTAPKDGSIVRLRDSKKMYNFVGAWDKKKKLWTGMAYSAFGSTRTYWDEEFCPIAEWSNV